jgi:hypothetical protein
LLLGKQEAYARGEPQAVIDAFLNKKKRRLTAFNRPNRDVADRGAA